MRGTVGERQSDRGMTRGTFHRVSHEKLLSTLTGRSGVSDGKACPAVPPFPGLISQLLLNLKCKGEVDICSLIPLLFFSPLPRYLSVVEHAAQREHSLRQLMQINFLMLIPVGTEHTVGALHSCVKLGVYPFHHCD